MADRIVYVHPTHMAKSTNIITPRDLDRLLEQNWRIVDRKRQRIEGKAVDVIHLTEANTPAGQGLTVAQPRDAHAPRESVPSGGRASTPRSLMASDFHGLPGLEVGNSLLIAHAYAMGTDAAHAGASEAACPWEPGSFGATEWVKGFRAASKQRQLGDTSGPTADAYALGKAAARGDADLVVHCPYPEGTPQFQEWIRGFTDAGGRVE